MTDTPSREQVIAAAVKAAMSNAYVCLPGRIEAVNHSKQTCDVQPMIKRRLRSAAGEVKFERLPVIKNVPLLFPRAGGFYSYLPPAVGNSVVLHFVDFSTDDWFERGAESEPQFSHSHELTDCFATPGGYAKPQALSGLSSTDAMLGKDGSPMIVLKSTGDVYLGSATPAGAVAMATPIQTQHNTHLHPTPFGPTSVPAAPMANIAATKVQAL